MIERTIFSRQPVLGAGTGQVQCLRSYIQRLALAHCMKPRKVLQVLNLHYPELPMTTAVLALAGEMNLHSGTAARRLRTALEDATGTVLQATTFEPLVGALSMRGCYGRGSMRYCPICVKEDKELPYGRLLWQFDFVVACPIHKVKLREHANCGAPESERLAMQHRPSADGVCAACGSVAFACIQDAPQEAEPEEVAMASELEKLLGHVGRTGLNLKPDLLKAGLAKVIDARWGSSPVHAATGAGLARSLVWMWMHKNLKPSLPAAIRFCLASRCDLVGLVEGELRPSTYAPTAMLVRGRYVRSNLPAATLKQLLIDASKLAEPPSMRAFARDLGIHHDAPRQRAPEETRLLLAARNRFVKEQLKAEFDEYVRSYSRAISELVNEGKSVHMKSVQQRCGIATFSSGKRRKALEEALAEHGFAVSGRETSRLHTPTTSRIGLLMDSIISQAFTQNSRTRVQA